MKAYELLLMIKPNIDSEDVQNVVNKIADSVANLGGKVIDTDLNGRKKLAYDIDNVRDAYQVIVRLELEGSKISEFNRQLKLNDNVLRMMFMELSKVKA